MRNNLHRYEKYRSQIQPGDCLTWEGNNLIGRVIQFGQESKNKHPAPFPVDLIERVISSTDAKIILDPFMGSGTTALAAKNLNRDFVGIDISPEYCEMAQQRL